MVDKNSCIYWFETKLIMIGNIASLEEDKMVSFNVKLCLHLSDRRIESEGWSVLDWWEGDTIKNKIVTLTFLLMPMGELLPGLRMLDPPLGWNPNVYVNYETM